MNIYKKSKKTGHKSSYKNNRDQIRKNVLPAAKYRFTVIPILIARH